jgi:hypothetical protein
MGPKIQDPSGGGRGPVDPYSLCHTRPHGDPMRSFRTAGRTDRPHGGGRPPPETPADPTAPGLFGEKEKG